MPTLKKGADGSINCETFDAVFRAELADIRERHNRGKRQKIPDEIHASLPTTALELTGLTCSGGGIRSASFCLGVLQGLQSKNVIEHLDYLSTVSGGGYVGTTMTIGMSRSPAASGQDGTFPFSRIDDERRETPEVRHLRDNSRYLLQNGLPSAASALVIYLRGIAMNVIALLPILLIVAALLVFLNPDTKEADATISQARLFRNH
jgi:Patatin-like phospholipase